MHMRLALAGPALALLCACGAELRSPADLAKALRAAAPVDRSPLVLELRRHPAEVRARTWLPFLGKRPLGLHTLAANELEELGPQVAELAVPALVAAFESEVLPPFRADQLAEDPELRAIQRAQYSDPARVPLERALAVMGDRAIAGVRGMLRADKALLRFHGAATAGRIGPAAAVLGEELCALAEGPDHAVAALAFWALGQAGVQNARVLALIEAASKLEADLLRLRSLELYAALLRRELAGQQGKKLSEEEIRGTALVNLGRRFVPGLLEDPAPLVRQSARDLYSTAPRLHPVPEQPKQLERSEKPEKGR